MAWLSGYSKRKPLTLTGGASGAQTDFQLSIAISYEAAMQGDFDDIRFTRADGTTLVDAWAEVIVTDTSATVWVEFPSTPANTVEQTYYMYYGKGDAVSDWDGAATFLQYHGSATSGFQDSEIISTEAVYEAKARVTGTGDDIWWGFRNSAGADHTIRSRSSNNYRYGMAYSSSGNGNYCSETPKFAQNTWYKLRIEMKSARTDHYVDDNQIASGIAGYFPSAAVGLFMTETAGGGEQEWSFARKYASGPPTYAFGSEESAPTGVAPTAVFYGPFFGPFRGPI